MGGYDNRNLSENLQQTYDVSATGTITIVSGRPLNLVLAAATVFQGNGVTVTGNNLSTTGTFQGDGSGLTNLPVVSSANLQLIGSSISGPVSNAVALINSSFVFTGLSGTQFQALIQVSSSGAANSMGMSMRINNITTSSYVSLIIQNGVQLGLLNSGGSLTIFKEGSSPKRVNAFVEIFQSGTMVNVVSRAMEGSDPGTLAMALTDAGGMLQATETNITRLDFFVLLEAGAGTRVLQGAQVQLYKVA